MHKLVSFHFCYSILKYDTDLEAMAMGEVPKPLMDLNFHHFVHL